MDMWLGTQGEPDLLTSEGYIDAFPTPDGSVISLTDDRLMEPVEDPPVLIAVMGTTGSGKTTFVNQASESHFKVGEALDSCTSSVQESGEFILDGRRVVLVDTPGFDDTYQSDTDVLKSIAAFLGESYSVGMKLSGIIYVHRISDDRFGGLAVKNFRMFRQLCGGKTLQNVTIMTNMWGRVTPQLGADREQQLRDKYFKAAIEKGAQLCRHTNTPESAQAILRKILKNTPLGLKIQHEMIREGKDIGQTGAGAELNREICTVVARYQRGIRELEEEMQEATEGNDKEFLDELREERRRMQEEMEKLRKDLAEMKSKFEEARREMEERINARSKAQMKGIREAYKAQIREYEEKIKELERDGRGNTSQANFIKRMLAELRKKVNEVMRCIIM